MPERLSEVELSPELSTSTGLACQHCQPAVGWRHPNRDQVRVPGHDTTQRRPGGQYDD